MDLVHARALCLTFLNVYISVTTHELLTYSVHDVFVVFLWIWNISLRAWPLGQEARH